MNDLNKHATEFMEQWKNMLPQVKFNKNGYEIRAQMLEMAQSQAWQDYYTRLGAFETSVRREQTKEGTDIVTEVKIPETPGVDVILDTAQKFYDFVNQKKVD